MGEIKIVLKRETGYGRAVRSYKGYPIVRMDYDFPLTCHNFRLMVGDLTLVEADTLRDLREAIADIEQDKGLKKFIGWMQDLQQKKNDRIKNRYAKKPPTT